jgi:hypothetical protein
MFPAGLARGSQAISSSNHRLTPLRLVTPAIAFVETFIGAKYVLVITGRKQNDQCSWIVVVVLVK